MSVCPRVAVAGSVYSTIALRVRSITCCEIRRNNPRCVGVFQDVGDLDDLSVSKRLSLQGPP